MSSSNTPRGRNKKNKTRQKKRVVFVVSFFVFFVSFVCFVCLACSFCLCRLALFFCLVWFFSFRLFRRNYTMMRIMTPKAIMLTPYPAHHAKTMPKAIILMYAAYKRYVLTPYCRHHANNHAKGNNAYACGVQESYAHAIPRSSCE